MSDMTASKALAEVKKFSQFIKAFEHIQEVATFLAQAENLVTEADKRRQAIDSETEEQLAAISELKDQTHQARRALVDTLAETTERATTILADARAAADEVTIQADDQVAVAKQSLATLRDDINKTSQNFDRIKSDYNRVTKQLAKVREGIRDFVGID